MLDGIFQIVGIISNLKKPLEEKVVSLALDSFQVPYETGGAVV